MNKSFFLGAFGVALGALVLFPERVRAANQPSKDEPAVQLSPFEVTAERLDFKKWIKVSSPHFVIYSDASQKEIYLLAKHMEMMRQAVQFYFHLELRTAPPLMVVLPTQSSDWHKVEFKDVQWKVASTLAGASRQVVLLEDDWQEHPGLLYSMEGGYICELMNIEGPLWLHTGLVSFFDTVDFDGDTLTVGKEGARETPISDFGWMPWDRFFAVMQSSPEYYKDSRSHNIYFAQTAALIHYLLTNSDRKYVTALLTWSAFLQGQEHWTEDDFKRIFGVDTTTLQNNIVELLKGGRYVSGKITFRSEALHFPMATSPAGVSEMRELFVLLQTEVRHTPDTAASLDAFLKNGLKSETLREILADACLMSHRNADAINQYRLLIEKGSTNPQVFYQGARLRLSEKDSFNPDTRLGGDYEEIEQWAKRSFEMDPVNFPACESLAWVKAKQPMITAADAAEIAQLCHLLNGKFTTDRTLAALAMAYWRLGNQKKADQIDKLLLGSPFTRPEPKKLAAELQRRLGAGPAPAPKP